MKTAFYTVLECRERTKLPEARLTFLGENEMDRWEMVRWIVVFALVFLGGWLLGRWFEETVWWRF